MAEECVGEYLLIYIYDESGAPIGMQYQYAGAVDTFETFWFEKNLFGDIVAVYDANLAKLVSYDYDAYDNRRCKSHLGYIYWIRRKNK